MIFAGTESEHPAPKRFSRWPQNTRSSQPGWILFYFALTSARPNETSKLVNQAGGDANVVLPGAEELGANVIGLDAPAEVAGDVEVGATAEGCGKGIIGAGKIAGIDVRVTG